MAVFKFGEILLPASVDTENWAVVACDQYTSNKGYWNALGEKLTDPTALSLVFPECYLGDNDEERISKIIEKQAQYIRDGVMKEVDGTILVKRTTEYGNTRYGLMALVNLDDYTNEKGKKTLIRATEGLVIERIPPRVAIRRDCLFELPHIMVLIDDPNRTVIEPLIGSGEIMYDGELNGKGGHITGYNIRDTKSVENALNSLVDDSVNKYGESLAFLVGDGNHSLATAKACRDESNPLSQYALVEIVNIYDEGLKFEPIHRALFNIDNEKFFDGLKKLTANETGTAFVFDGSVKYGIPFPSDAIEGVKLVQNYIDAYLKDNGGEVDYIHGENDLKELCAEKGCAGILLGAIDKSTFFSYVVKNGVLPRKTFSMGEANEKRYYMEARRIKK